MSSDPPEKPNGRRAPEPESPETVLAAQHTRLSELEAREQEIRALREREQDLEVERIAARVAMESARRAPGPAVEPAAATAIVESLDRRDALAGSVAGMDAALARGRESRDSEMHRLNLALDALETWVEPGSQREATRLRRAIDVAVLAGTVLVVWLAFAVHLVFLVLLVPVGATVSLLSWSGQDAAWRKLGAKRRFEETELAPPAAWEAQAVRARAGEIRAQIASLAARGRDAGARAGLGEERDAAALDLAAEEEHLAELLMEGGLDAHDLDADAVESLRLAARAHRAGRDLDGVKEALHTAGSGAGEVRERVFRYLAREGVAPPDGRADLEALAEGLERLGARRRRED